MGWIFRRPLMGVVEGIFVRLDEDDGSTSTWSHVGESGWRCLASDSTTNHDAEAGEDGQFPVGVRSVGLEAASPSPLCAVFFFAVFASRRVNVSDTRIRAAEVFGPPFPWPRKGPRGRPRKAEAVFCLTI